VANEKRVRAVFRVGESDASRVEAFSDGVLAIVITLLVLEIGAPHLAHPTDAELWTALEALLPKIVAWVVSFFFVLVFWVAHHYFFGSLARVDRGILWLNGLFLLFISFTPFPTAFAGDYPLRTPPLALLSVVMLGAAASFTALRLYALMGEGLIASNTRNAARAALMRSVVAPVLYACAALAAFVSPWASIALLAAVPLIFFFPSRNAHQSVQSNP
jgi:uncharacterized membrane protein